MGIYPYIKKLAGVKLSINQRILKWCFKAPFSLLINTNDGSGKSKDVKNLLNYKTKYKLLLNGANVFDIHLKSHFETKKNINTKSITCLFIGKLEVYKGCITFVETIIEATLSRRVFVSSSFSITDWISRISSLDIATIAILVIINKVATIVVNFVRKLLTLLEDVKLSCETPNPNAPPSDL